MTKSISILGCGWLGLPLAKKLLSVGYKVKGSTTSEEKISQLEKAGIDSYLLSIHEDKMNGAFAEFLESEMLIINIPPRRKSPEAYPRQMKLLIPQIAKSSIKKVLFVSSTSVYPDTNSIIDETCDLPPEKNSGKVLIEVEKLFQANENFEITILRFAGLIGPNRNPGRFLSGKEIKNHPDSVVNLIHLEDCIGLMIKLLEKNAWGEVFNACSSIHPKKAEFYLKAASLANFDPPVFIPDSEMSFKIISNKKIIGFTDYEFVFPNPLDSL